MSLRSSGLLRMLIRATGWLAEDPFLRKEYGETLAKEGVQSMMEEELYHPPAGQRATAAE